MIADLKPYEKYKESGLPWLGKFPAQWVIKRGKSYLYAVDKRSEKGSEELLTVSSARGVVPRRTANVTMFKAESYAGHKLCWPNDLVINSLWAWAGGLGVSQHHGIISTAYSVYRGRPSAGINPRFLHELVRSSAFHWELKVRSKGVWISRLQLTDTAFLDAPIPLPPPDEQAAIVRFLNWANGRLEKAIRAKRKVIALLNEQKQAIIHRAVTRGLNPNAPLKPSGIPWLGDIPQHWGVAKFKHFFRVRMGQTFLKPDLSETGELPVLSATMSGAILGYTARAKARTLLREGDLVIPARGNSIGYVALVNQLCTSSQTTIQAIRIPNERLSTRFAHLFSVGNKPFLYSFVQTAIPQITTQEVASNPVLLPPMSEQTEICDAVDAECSGLITGIARTEREIALMQEYRTRLTADVVTGKLDVRGAASKLPDEAPTSADPEESELEDETAEEELVA
ncbi:restriction endonuclease subunit S [bacterium]|nr:restriction endonuclease subunit S [bacterium]